MEEKKLSQFNIIVKYKNGFLLYNTLNQAIIEFDKKTYNRLKNQKLQEDEFNILLKKGIIVDKNIDEFENFKKQQIELIDTDKQNSVGLVIALTPKCNFNCFYCFEKNNNNFPSNFELTKVFDKIISLTKNADSKKLNITWFGGEPLLEYQNIIDLSKKILIYCKENNIEYNAGIVTNGLLLTEEKFVPLLNSKLTQIQITLDGLEENFSKAKRCDKKCFYQIIENINKASKFFKVRIRINCVKNNKKDIYKIIDMFCNNKNIEIVFAPVINYNEKNKMLYKNKPEFLSTRLKYIKYALTKGISLNLDRDGLKPSMLPCSLYRKNNFAIDNLGNLYNCEHYLFNKNKIIDISSKKDYNVSITNCLNNYRTDCKKCSLYAICHNGCMADNNNLSNGDCKKFLKYVKSYVKIFSNIKNKEGE